MVTGNGPTDGLIGKAVDLEPEEEQVSSLPLAALTRAEDPPPESTHQSVADWIEASQGGDGARAAAHAVGPSS